MIFDLETSGLSPFLHEVIEIAGLRFEPNGEITCFHSLVKPEKLLEAKNMAIHGIQNEDLKDAPSIQSVLPDFVKFFEGANLWAHNAQFDIGFISAEAMKCDIKLPQNKTYDTCRLAKSNFKKTKQGPNKYNLKSLAEYFDIQFNHHRALEDTLATSRVFFKLMEKLQSNQYPVFLEKSLVFKLTDQSQMQTQLQTHPLYEQISEAIREQKHLNIRYNGGTMGKKPRPVRPIACLPMPKGIHLYAECLLSHHHKAFRLDKILEILKSE